MKAVNTKTVYEAMLVLYPITLTTKEIITVSAWNHFEKKIKKGK
jgi:hypothetical protein